MCCSMLGLQYMLTFTIAPPILRPGLSLSLLVLPVAVAVPVAVALLPTPLRLLAQLAIVIRH